MSDLCVVDLLFILVGALIAMAWPNRKSLNIMEKRDVKDHSCPLCGQKYSRTRDPSIPKKTSSVKQSREIRFEVGDAVWYLVKLPDGRYDISGMPGNIRSLRSRLPVYEVQCRDIITTFDEDHLFETEEEALKECTTRNKQCHKSKYK